jgi:hypothetical protein
MRRALLPSFTVLLLAAALPGCGSHDPLWDSAPEALLAHGLADAAALVDTAAERALILPVAADYTLDPVSVPIGPGYAASRTTADGQRLLLLMHGDVPRLRSTDAAPTLQVLRGGSSPGLAHSYDLGDPLSGLELDPESRFAVVYPSAADTAFVQNPNQLSIADLSLSPSETNPTPLTLRSFGGRPQGFFFTPELALPRGPRRLLVTMSDRDVGIIDLSAPALGDLTVRLSASGQIAVTDGAADDDNDARIAIRTQGDSNVTIVDLLPLQPEDEGKKAHDFRTQPNVVYAGGIPSDIAFVNTDGGLRLAALVPSANALMLVDPATGVPTSVDLGLPFDRLSIVTSIVGAGSAGADVALLWSTYSASIAFVSLGQTVGKPYKSVDRLDLDMPVSAVYDVPAPNERLKILAATDGQTFFVLDLVTRTASPIVANGGAQLSIAPDGQRGWMFTPSSAVIASLPLDNLHPHNLTMPLPVVGAFDVARRGGGRALVAVHPTPAVSITVLDGEKPTLETAVTYGSVLLGGLQ